VKDRKNNELSRNEPKAGPAISSFLSRMISFSSISHLFQDSTDQFDRTSSKLQSDTIKNKHLSNSLDEIPRSNKGNQSMSTKQKGKLMKNLSLESLSSSANTIHITNLTLKSFKELLSEYQNSGFQDPSAILYTIQNIFSSRSKLGNSFLGESDCQTLSIPLFLDTLDTFYNLILNLVCPLSIRLTLRSHRNFLRRHL
jgi:hypothetical protein